MAQTPEQMTASMIANMPEKTGKSLEQWLAIARASGNEKHGDIVRSLKDEHGLGHGYANLVAHVLKDAPADDGEGLLEQQYAGAKAGLRPIHDALMRHVLAFGKDIEAAPKKGYVSLRRSKQFAIVQPSTKTRLDVGINLKGQPATERLEASGSFNAMVSHRVRVDLIEQVDAELIAWLREAYERA